MNTCQEVRNNIKNLNAYLTPFPLDQQSAAVEQLFSNAVSLIFHLPFFTAGTDDAKISQKVIWFGHNGTNLRKAPAGHDAIVFARHFDVLMEITQNTGTQQWNREFARSVRHIKDYIKINRKGRDEVYLLLIVREIHRDTYESIRQKIRDGFNIVLLTFKNIEQILEVCGLAIGLRHFDLKQLFGTIIRFTKDITSLTSFNRRITPTISDWRKKFLKNDKFAYVGIKSYNLFKTTKRTYMTASDIATELFTQKEVKAYFRILKESLTKECVCDGMLTFGFACETGIPQPDPILTIVSKLEIEERIKEILANIEKD